MKRLLPILALAPVLAWGNPFLYTKDPVPLNPFLHAFFTDNGVPQVGECGWVKTATTQKMACDLAYIIGTGSHVFTALYRQDAGCNATECWLAGESPPSLPLTHGFNGVPASPLGLTVGN